MFGILAVALAALLYCCVPGDTSGQPYPTGRVEIQAEIVRLEQWLETLEPEYQKLVAYATMKTRNNFFCEDTRKTLGHYDEWAKKRRNAKYRLSNLKKLLEKYEEIDATFNPSKPDNCVAEG